MWNKGCVNVLFDNNRGVWYVPKDRLERAKYILIDQPRGSGKTTFLAKYALSLTGTTVMISLNFRNSKQLIDKVCEGLRKDFSLGGGPHNKTVNVGDNRIIALPISGWKNSGRIHGYRANSVLVDDFEHCDKDIVETAIMGLIAVTNSPVQRVIANELGLVVDDPKSEKIILCGTNDTPLFDDYVEKWKTMIENPDYLFIGRDQDIKDYTCP